MNKYELLFIIDNSAADEAKEAIIAKMSQLVTDNGGSVEKVDKWARKNSLTLLTSRKTDTTF